MATDSTIAPWHPLDNPECTNCRGLSRPVRPRRKTFARDGVICHPQRIPLQLNEVLAFRKHLRSLLSEARLPQDRFARIIKVTQTTVSHWLFKGTPSPENRAYVDSIRSIRRLGKEVHVVYDIGTVGIRGDAHWSRGKEATNVAQALEASPEWRQLKASLPCLSFPVQTRRGRRMRQRKR